MRLNAYEAFLTNIRCIGIGAATFRPTGPRPKKHGGVIGQKGGHVTVTSPVQMKIHWKSWHITEIGMTPPWCVPRPAPQLWTTCDLHLEEMYGHSYRPVACPSCNTETDVEGDCGGSGDVCSTLLPVSVWIMRCNPAQSCPENSQFLCPCRNRQASLWAHQWCNAAAAMAECGPASRLPYCVR